jgi:integrase
MAKSHLRVVAPTEVLRTVPPKRAKNAELRTREDFTPDEAEALIEAARTNRHGHRDATMILLAFRHGLRASEVCDLRWDQVDFNGGVAPPTGQERHSEHSSDPGRRAAGAAAATP